MLAGKRPGAWSPGGVEEGGEAEGREVLGGEKRVQVLCPQKG